MELTLLLALYVLLMPGSSPLGALVSNVDDTQESSASAEDRRALLLLTERPLARTEAGGSIHQAVRTDSAEAQSYYDKGLAHLASYDWVRAARVFHEALRRDAGLTLPHAGLARAYRELNEHDAAKRHLATASAVARNAEVPAYETRWVALAQLEAKVLATEAPRNASLHEGYKRAIEDVIREYPGDANLRVLRGNAEEPRRPGRGQLGGVGAVGWYRAALKLSSDHLGAHHFLVHSYENLGQLELALRHARRYARLASGAPHAHHMYGHVLARANRWDEALRALKTADQLHRRELAKEDIDPRLVWHYRHNLRALAMSSWRSGHPRRAKALWHEIYRLDYGGWRGAIDCAPLIEYLLHANRLHEALDRARQCQRRPHPAARVVGRALAAEALIGLGRLPEARGESRGVAAALAEVRQLPAKEPNERFLPAILTALLKPLEIKLALSGSQPRRARNLITAFVRRVAHHRGFDTWALGMFRIERLRADALRLGFQELATTIDELTGTLGTHAVERSPRKASKSVPLQKDGSP